MPWPPSSISVDVTGSGPCSRQWSTIRRTSSSLTNEPWMRLATEELPGRSNMSPLPTSFSAPGWSRITRESVRLDTAKAIRAGMFALMTPVMTLTDGRWVATIRWIPTARAFWAMRVIDSSTSRAATIIRSFSSSTTTTMYGRCSYGVSSGCTPAGGGILPAAIAAL